MKRKITIIIEGQILSIIVYFSIYLVKSFVIWKFTNPFQWIIDLPTYNLEGRSAIVMGGFLYYFIIYSIAKEINTKKG